MLKKAIIIGVILSVVLVCILNASAIISFFQGSSYSKVTVVEGQVSVIEFGDKRYTFAKDRNMLYIYPWLPNGTNCVIPSEGSVYHWNGIEIAVQEVRSDWFVLLVKPEWD